MDPTRNPLSDAWTWARNLVQGWLQDSTNSIALLFFLATLFLFYPQFFPSLDEINPFDESAYVNSGRMLLDKGTWPTYAGNPLMDVFYASTYLPYSNSPYWLVQSDALGRIILFSLLWLSAYLVARQLSRFFHQAIMLGLLLVVPLMTEMLRFPSDPLFAALAGFSLSQLLAYYNTSLTKHIWWSSAFMGLAALARNDGLVLFFILLACSLLLSLPRKQAGRALLATTVPFLLLVGGYVLVYGASTGQFELGTMKRTYDNFEAGQEAISGRNEEMSSTMAAKLEARRFFGTPQENNYSIFRAIRRNPQVYLQRLADTVKGLPIELLHAYGIRFAAVIFLLVLRGVIKLIREKEYALLAILCLWPAHLATGFLITIFREGHLQFPYYVVFALASIGLAAVLAVFIEGGKERFAWTILLVGLSVVSVLTDKLAIFYGSALFLGSLWLISFLKYHLLREKIQESYPIALLILLCTGLIIHGNFPAPGIRALGVTAKEQAVVYMAEHLEPGSKVAAASPGPVWMAKMEYTSLIATDLPRDKSSEEFLAWMKKHNIQAVYVDHGLYNNNPAMWALIRDQVGKGMKRVYSGDNGDIQVLFLNQ